MCKSIIYGTKNICGSLGKNKLIFTEKIPTCILDKEKIIINFICTNSILYKNLYYDTNNMYDKIKSNYDNESKRTSHHILDKISENINIEVHYPLLMKYHYISIEHINHELNWYLKSKSNVKYDYHNKIFDEWQIIGNILYFK